MATTNPTVPSQPAVAEIRSRAFPDCSLCGVRGEALYTDLKDQLFGAPGTWTLKRCPRPECGLVWLDPMPLEQDIHKAYANYHTHEDASTFRESWIRRAYNFVKQGYLAHKYGYQMRSSAWQKMFGLLMYLVPTRRAVIDSQVLFLPAKKRGILLDVGCGSGQTLVSMANLGWQVQGVEPDPIAVQVATAKGLNVHQGTLESQQFEAGSFDAIFMSHVIEHVHDPVSVLKESYRVLKPGGRLVLVTPNIRSWGRRLYKSHWRGLEPPRHLQIFARSSLLRLSGLASFASHKCRAVSRGAGEIVVASHFLRKNKTPAGGVRIISRICAAMIGLVEWAGSCLDPDAGEELVLVADK